MREEIKVLCWFPAGMGTGCELGRCWKILVSELFFKRPSWLIWLACKLVDEVKRSNPTKTFFRKPRFKSRKLLIFYAFLTFFLVSFYKCKWRFYANGRMKLEFKKGMAKLEEEVEEKMGHEICKKITNWASLKIM